MLILGFKLICDYDLEKLLNYVNAVVGYDVVLKPLTLLCEIDGAEVTWNLCQKFASASSTGVFESVVLQNCKPNER